MSKKLGDTGDTVSKMAPQAKQENKLQGKKEGQNME